MDKETFFEKYPEAAPLIYEDVERRDEEAVLDDYYVKALPAGVLIDIPEKEELPFFDEDEHGTMTGEERDELAGAMGRYLENVREAGGRQ